jgi:hypothetical protein
VGRRVQCQVFPHRVRHHRRQQLILQAGFVLVSPALTNFWWIYHEVRVFLQVFYPALFVLTTALKHRYDTGTCLKSRNKIPY